METGYDAKNRVSTFSNTVGNVKNITHYVYSENMPDMIDSVKVNNETVLNYSYDGLARMARRTLNTTTPYKTEYSYLPGTGGTTTILESVKNSEDTLSYTYDGGGNILTISKNGVLTNSYFYYELHGYLAREIDHVTGKHTVYYYGSEGSPSGNMTQRTSYILNADGTKTDEQTVNYQYRDSNWKDKLTNYNGTEISYDEIGNPLNWRGDMFFTWQNGRQLAAASANGKNLSFAYDANGIRRQKTVDGTATDFYLNGDKIMAQKTGDTRLDFLYDDASDLLGFRYNGQSYYYVRNGQGDITSIIDNSGTEIVSYTYDSWGAPLSITGTQAETIGQLNPFRYRGYYYDTDTGLYYLNSRYYDPEVGRFLNADFALGVNDDLSTCNLFLYCSNNPVNCSDDTGEGKVWNWVKKTATKAWNWIMGNSTPPANAASIGHEAHMKYAQNNNSSNIQMAAEHQTNRRPSNKNKHQQGQKRKQMDQSGKKGDARRKSRSNKRRIGIQPVALIVAVGASLAIVYIVVNDITGVGVTDDVALVPLIKIFTTSATKIIEITA